MPVTPTVPINETTGSLQLFMGWYEALTKINAIKSLYFYKMLLLIKTKEKQEPQTKMTGYFQHLSIIDKVIELFCTPMKYIFDN